LEGIGFQRRQIDFELLKNFANDDGYLGIVRSGALRGIGNFRNQQAFDFLKSRLEYGNDTRESRPVALAAFAEASSWLPEIQRKEATEILCKLLRDPEEKVFKAAVSGLVNLKASSASESLESLRKGTYPALQVWIERQIRKLKQTSEEGAKDLKKEVEDLHKKIRKLEEEVSEMKAKEK